MKSTFNNFIFKCYIPFAGLTCWRGRCHPNLHCHFYFEKYSCNMTASSPRLQMICIYHSLLVISSNFYCEDCWMENMLFSMLGYFCFLYNFEIHVKSWVLIKSRKWALHIFQDILPCHAVAMGKINWASIFLNAYPRLMERSRYSLGWLYICFQKTVQSVCAYWCIKTLPTCPLITYLWQW